jgi:pimeloyl-ACP methyl ester carboxylesterase
MTPVELPIDRAFVRIAEGQVHLRRAGERRVGQTALWMMHASPASSATLTGLITEFAQTRAVIAPDTLGNGDSAPPAVAAPDIAYYAAANFRVMDALGLDQVDLYGSHTGAHIAVEMAILAPHRVRRIVLDGIGMFAPAERAKLLAEYAPAITPDAIGSQFHWAWHFVRDQAWFFPYFERDRAHNRGIGSLSPDALHLVTVEVLKSIRTYHHAYRAAFAHPSQERLPLVQQRTLAIADEDDPLSAGIDTAVALLPAATKLIVSPSRDAAGRRAKAARITAFLDAA